MTCRVVLIESEEGVAVFWPSLAGCASQGATEAEALANIADAIAELTGLGGTPARDGGAAEAELLREAAEERLWAVVREMQIPVAT